jgi:sedoheptulose-bisphosphatase
VSRPSVGDTRPLTRLRSYVSPRTRAQRTLELLDIGCHDPFPWQTEYASTHETPRTDARVSITPDIAEWDYGDYEGITSAEIRAQRATKGLGPPHPAWDIWRDGCPGGELPEDIIERVDRLIADIREKYHKPVSGKPLSETKGHGDVMVVGHGHILRAFAMRWIGKPLTETALIMEAGGVGTLSYEHHSIDEPAILLGGGFVVGDEVNPKK